LKTKFIHFSNEMRLVHLSAVLQIDGTSLVFA